MTASASSSGDVLAPIDFIVVDFPDGVPSAGGFEQLHDLVERNVIYILDVEFIRKDGSAVRPVAVSDLPRSPGLDLTEWAHASSGLLDFDDVATSGAQIGDDAWARIWSVGTTIEAPSDVWS